jgi:hypothetical protein
VAVQNAHPPFGKPSLRQKADLSPRLRDEPTRPDCLTSRFFGIFDLDQGEDCIVTYLNLTKFPGPPVALATGGFELVS